MQSDVPPLPISCLTKNIRLSRNSNDKPKPAEIPEKTNTPIKSNPATSFLVHKKKSNPVIAGSSPYTSITRYNPPDIDNKPLSKSGIDQRVSSAKMLRIKQLQNQLTDAHFHLNELSNENKLLKAIQKRQDAALKRYEGTKAELPRIINTHQEDYRVLLSKYKKLRSQYKDTSDTLKEKESELHSLQAQNKKLLQLSKDRHLLEREKLQTQVFDLNHRVDQQDEIIQTLKRKLALESKYLKHQLHVEMVKHKETQKQLHDTQLKLKSLEELAEQREKKLYHASHVFFNKDKPRLSSQSLTNLNDSASESAPKGQTARRRRFDGTKGQSLPALGDSASLRRSQSQENPRRMSSLEALTTTETLANFRLQRSPASHRATAASLSSRSSIKDSPIKESRLEADESKSSHNVEIVAKQTYELPKVLTEEYGYESDEKDDDDDDDRLGYDPLGLASRSRSLHTRLVSSAVEGTRTSKEPPPIISRPRSFSKENMERMEKMNENDSGTKYDRDSVVTVISRDMLSTRNSEVNHSDVESEMEVPVAFDALDEEDKGRRKSDIDKSEVEKQRKSSTDYSTSSSFSNSSSDFQRNDSVKEIGKAEFKSINGLTIHPESYTTDIGPLIDTIISRKKSVSKEKSTSISSDDDYEKIVLEEEHSNKTTKDQEKQISKAENISREMKKSDSHFYEFNDDGTGCVLTKSDLKSNTEQKTADESSKSFDKAKLLAAMKAIDDNENIEYIEPKPRKIVNNASRLQITDNLYKGIPSHSKKKSDIMKELFSDIKLDNKASK